MSIFRKHGETTKAEVEQLRKAMRAIGGDCPVSPDAPDEEIIRNQDSIIIEVLRELGRLPRMYELLEMLSDYCADKAKGF